MVWTIYAEILSRPSLNYVTSVVLGLKRFGSCLLCHNRTAIVCQLKSRILSYKNTLVDITKCIYQFRSIRETIYLSWNMSADNLKRFFIQDSWHNISHRFLCLQKVLNQFTQKLSEAFGRSMHYDVRYKSWTKLHIIQSKLAGDMSFHYFQRPPATPNITLFVCFIEYESMET